MNEIEQKLVTVNYGESYNYFPEKEIVELMENGWCLKQMCPVPRAGGSYQNEGKVIFLLERSSSPNDQKN